MGSILGESQLMLKSMGSFEGFPLKKVHCLGLWYDDLCISSQEKNALASGHGVLEMFAQLQHVKWPYLDIPELSSD